VGRSLSGVLLSIGHVVFAYHFALMVLQLGRKGGGPVYFQPVEEAVP
jgi:cytochrome c oxidase cbb3-type subunit 1